MKLADIKTQEQAKDFLKSIGYGEKRDYPKIYINGGIGTTWARSLKVAKIAFFAVGGVWPSSCEYVE